METTMVITSRGQIVGAISQPMATIIHSELPADIVRETVPEISHCRLETAL